MKYGDLTLGQIEAYISMTAGDSATVKRVLSRQAFMTCHEAWRIKEWKWVVLASDAVCALVAPTGWDLGLSDDVNREDIYKRARQMGLRLCPTEVIGQIRDLGDFQSVTVATELLGDIRNPYLVKFDVHDNELLQDRTPVGPGMRFSADHRWVFQEEDDGGPI